MDDLRIVMRRLKFALIGALLLAAAVQFAHQGDDEFSSAATRSPKMAQRSNPPASRVDFTSVGVVRPHKAQKPRKAAPVPDAEED